MRNDIQHIVSTEKLSTEQISRIFKLAEELKSCTDVYNEYFQVMRKKILAAVFIDSSTRTRLSFDAAMQKIGGNVITVSGENDARTGGFFSESFEDTIRVIGEMADCILFRTKEPQNLHELCCLSHVPLINGGDGDNEHPTQALLDLWVISQELGTLSNKKIGLAGDLNWRSMNSFCNLIKNYPINSLVLYHTNEDSTFEKKIKFFNEKGINYEVQDSLDSVLIESDVLVMVPFMIGNFESYKNGVRSIISEKNVLNKKRLKRLNVKTPILHIGPRGEELSHDVDNFPQVLFFKQVKESIFIRMAILIYLMSN